MNNGRIQNKAEKNMNNHMEAGFVLGIIQESVRIDVGVDVSPLYF